MANHAGDVINKISVGKDGKTSYEIIKGKKFKKPMIEFGERILFRVGKKKRAKLKSNWDDGIYLGMDWRTGVYRVCHNGSMIVAHAIRRVPFEQRWNSEMVLQTRGTP